MTPVTPSTTITVPDVGLVVLAGAPGSGKSTFARAHFAPGEVFSSDAFRALVSGDASDQGASADAFAAMGAIVSARAKRGLFTVVDATNSSRADRARWAQVAKEHHVPATLVIIDVPVGVALDRVTARAASGGRGVPVGVVKQMAQALDGVAGRARNEGFRRVRVVDGTRLGEVRVERTPLLSDARRFGGPFDVIGDVHGCAGELVELLGVLGYDVARDDAGRPVGAAHPKGRRAVFVGDLVDRGPDSPGVLRLVIGMCAGGSAMAVAGNHDVKFARALGGAKVTLNHGLDKTMEQLDAVVAEGERGFPDAVRAFIEGLPEHLVLDGGALVIAHAGLKEAYHGRESGAVRSFALYGDVTGERTPQGFPVRRAWEAEYTGDAMVVYGHTPSVAAGWVNNTICVDTACVFGGSLTALRYPERELASVASGGTYAPITAPLRDPAEVAAKAVARAGAQSGTSGSLDGD